MAGLQTLLLCGALRGEKAEKWLAGLLEDANDPLLRLLAIKATGCEYAITSDHRLKVILQGGIEIRDLYRLAAKSQVQIRRLAYKRDSLEDIFLKAMENGHGSS